MSKCWQVARALSYTSVPPLALAVAALNSARRRVRARPRERQFAPPRRCRGVGSTDRASGVFQHHQAGAREMRVVGLDGGGDVGDTGVPSGCFHGLRLDGEPSTAIPPPSSGRCTSSGP